ncbi:MAG: hypothetical protein CR982_07725 [Candidatus Cloacimonadota bacterium]|nr:MAG: hypothetical protein CR982_07725 [Candidatus Cloacimonadota bacterium]PIE78256.1 MAG: hypothetical protein CSA15_08815 [Candidatus Delongbacteria bacterium]
MNQSREEKDLSYTDICDIISSKRFDSSKRRESFFIEWDGRSSVDIKDLLKLYYSYDFDKMENRQSLGLYRVQIKKYMFYNNILKKAPFIYISIFLFLLLSVFFIKLNNIYIWLIVVVSYILIINLTPIVRRRVKKFREIKIL